MSQIEKLIQRLLRKPKDFTYDELKQIFYHFGFVEDSKGRTSGSRTSFKKNNHESFRMHKPHPNNELKPYQIEKVVKDLKEWGYIK